MNENKDDGTLKNKITILFRDKLGIPEGKFWYLKRIHWIVKNAIEKRIRESTLQKISFTEDIVRCARKHSAEIQLKIKKIKV